MTALKIDQNETALLRAHYEGVMRDTLRIIWHRKLLVAAILVAALVLASIALVLVGPRYTGEAIIQLSFSREESASSARSQPIVSVEAAALVDSAARVIRSRTTASAVVARLGLDKDPTFTRQSFSWRVLSSVRSALGMEQAVPPDRDLAVSALMRQVTVTNEPRSYLISVAVTASDPERAARLANAVASEYLRAQMLQQLTETYAAAESEVAELSAVYGVHHPNPRYLDGRAKLERLQARLSALRQEAPNEDVVNLVSGQRGQLLPAETVMVPSGPNIVLILALTAGAALVLGAWLAVLLGRGLAGWNRAGYGAARGDEAVLHATGSNAESSPLASVTARGLADGPMGRNGKIVGRTLSPETGTEETLIITGTLAATATDASAQWRRGWGPGIAAGIIGGAIITGAILASPGPAGDFSGLIDTKPIRWLDRLIRTNAQRDPNAACVFRKSDVNCPDPRRDSE